MPIASSAFTEGPTQVCGRRYVTERHIADDGTVHTFEWLGSQDAQAVLEDRAAALNEAMNG